MNKTAGTQKVDYDIYYDDEEDEDTHNYDQVEVANTEGSPEEKDPKLLLGIGLIIGTGIVSIVIGIFIGWMLFTASEPSDINSARIGDFTQTSPAHTLDQCDVYLEQHCFTFMVEECPDGCTLDQARAVCNKTGGRLAEPRSGKQMSIVLKIQTLSFVENYWWMGASDKDTEGVWRWDSDGTEALSLSSLWASGQRNGAEDCLQLGWGDPVPGGLHDVPCDFGVEKKKKFKPVCEFVNVTTI
eukprot:GFUD01083749.1.p1 GENE.GFUD01083749.1~~GFUD01083749.1.p1  ORF type:complete len:242 (+),score=70.66 GFUD01083749.1:143-868(+)